MRVNSLALVCLLSVFVVVSSGVYGDTVYKVIIKKQEEKKKWRWSIEDWFKTRDRLRLQDLWFKLHAPSPYEFYIAAEYQFAARRGGVVWNAQTTRLSLAGYASIFGIEGQFEFRNNYWLAIVHLRIFGYHAQGTNITLQGGIRQVNNPQTYRNPFAAVDMTIYITKYVGLEFLYRYFFDSLANQIGVKTNGDRWEGIGFIDFQFIRLYAGAFTEREHTLQGAPGQDNNRYGFQVGTKIFF